MVVGEAVWFGDFGFGCVYDYELGHICERALQNYFRLKYEKYEKLLLINRDDQM